MRVSNVDKLSQEGEISVRLCNYSDVYKNDRIRNDMPFMQATATAAEVSQFRLEPGDVLLTKDSETWNDIGVPAVVDSSADDLVSGYHLALLRPRGDRVTGPFLLRALQAPEVAYQFHVEANGVTRYGLSHDSIKSVRVPVPPLEEQKAIVRLLDYVDRRIRRYLRAKQKLITLLGEQKQAIIHRAVTRGLDPDVRLKPSGVEWLGDVPEHWDVVRLGTLLRERGETNEQGMVTDVLSLLRNRGVIPYDEKGNIGNKKSDDIRRYKVVRPDDIVLNSMNVIIGSVGLSAYTGCLRVPCITCLCAAAMHSPRFLNTIFQTRRFHRSLVRIGNGILAHRMRIPMALLKCEMLPRPPVEEQLRIVSFIDEMTAALNATLAATGHEIGPPPRVPHSPHRRRGHRQARRARGGCAVAGRGRGARAARRNRSRERRGRAPTPATPTRSPRRSRRDHRYLRTRPRTADLPRP